MTPLPFKSKNNFSITGVDKQRKHQVMILTMCLVKKYLIRLSSYSPNGWWDFWPDSHLVCTVCFVPDPGAGLWFGFSHFTCNHHRVPHVADYRLISRLNHLWSWWRTWNTSFIKRTRLKQKKALRECRPTSRPNDPLPHVTILISDFYQCVVLVFDLCIPDIFVFLLVKGLLVRKENMLLAPPDVWHINYRASCFWL